MKQDATFYVTTPIYYVNDRPHIGHVYSTTLADVLARYHRLCGDDVFFLTGTDEHAAKVSDRAAENGLSPQEWADRNAKAFQDTFAKLGMTNDDFIRTSQDRHKDKVTQYVEKLLATGDVYEGEYVGWYDAGQEEYIPENKAAEYEFKSPINRKPLVKKTEKNYFFRLSAYADRLKQYITEHPTFIQPEARKNEVLARIDEGLNDVPMSRTGTEGWGIPMPGDPSQSIYVWVDALFNYLTAIDTDERGHYWPADHHVIAKDILWFHAVIWPALLMALDRPLPIQVYAHSFWISEGKKMSKSLGNFIDLEKIDDYVEQFSLDALRYFLVTQGPLGATDSDFAHAKFVDHYNADLANTFGNCASRVSNMIARYFDGQLPESGTPDEDAEAVIALASGVTEKAGQYYEKFALSQAVDAAMEIVRSVDGYIEITQPFKLAKVPGKRAQLGTILYTCAEALRIASLVLWPVMPNKVETFWNDMIHWEIDPEEGRFQEWSRWGLLPVGNPVTKAAALFPRVETS